MDNYHYYEPERGHGLRHNPLNAIIAPRPIGWIGTKGRDGGLNLAPYSFFNAFNYDPPIIGFSSTEWKDSVRNATDTGEFTWNLVSRELGQKMNLSSKPVAPDVNEFVLADLTPVKGRRISSPRVGESLVSMECKVVDILQYTDINGKLIPGWLILGQVIAVYIEKSLIKEGVYQTALGSPVMRCGGLRDYAVLTKDVMFQMDRSPRRETMDSHGI